MLAEIMTDELGNSNDQDNSENYTHYDDDSIGCFHSSIVAQLGQKWNCSWIAKTGVNPLGIQENEVIWDFTIDFFDEVWYNRIMDYER